MKIPPLPPRTLDLADFVPLMSANLLIKIRERETIRRGLSRNTPGTLAGAVEI